MSKSRMLMVAGGSAVLLGAVGLVVRSIQLSDLDLAYSVSLGAMAVGLAAFLLVLLFGQRSLRSSHELLRQRTQRTVETVTESRGSIATVAAQVRALDERFTRELDKRQLEWFEAAEILEDKLGKVAGSTGDISTQVGHLSTRLTYVLEKTSELEADVARDSQNAARQMAAVTRICSTLPLRSILPAFDDWTVSPDLAAEVLERVFSIRPKVIVETGSGLSTILMGYAVEMLGSGRVFALEHDEGFCQKTMEGVRTHGLEEYVTVIHAPLSEYTLDDRHYSWYSIERVELPNEIDLLLVDGPPSATNRQARYPAWPLLSERLAPAAQVILDDADRADEGEMVRRWLDGSGNWSAERMPLERGAIVLTRAG